ncbi:MAG: leucyl/phenylalanyl-tRNA--protein transferase [Phaeodactylibacter sp.]|nr:leucyl/phenylalanyl-tRNA--protein transferase [Phaeodactylibacter sp.]MCB9053046.1 leucyl/phenylalanyl-tRNA--protein transferase [Lewinellaceae bacterium]
MPIFWLSEHNLVFPNPELADPQGVLAIGGDLSPQRLLKAYSMGIFPWFGPGEPILWWSPDPRFVLFPDELKVARSMRPYFNQRKFDVTFDGQFETVMRKCAAQYRPGQGGTWITKGMVKGYTRLHEMGYAHSVEVMQDGQLVGGLYGIALGRIFFGESMFSEVNNASKFGFITLVRQLEKKGFWLVDCQQETRHLASLGARSIAREQFLGLLEKNGAEPMAPGSWSDWGEEN